MPRSGGVYSLPTGNPVASGSVASSSVMNTTLDDLGDEITNSIPRDGTAPPTANVAWGNYRLTALGDAAAATDALNRQSADARYFAAQAVVKTSNTDRSSTTTLADDPDLTLALSTGTYEYELSVFYTLLTATTGGFKMAVPYSSTSSLHRVSQINYNGTLSGFPNSSGSTLESGFALNGSSADTEYMALFRGIIITTGAGNLRLQWAQNTSNANAARVLPGSKLIARKIA